MLPPYARRSKNLEALIPILYLKGVSTGDFAEALAALLGPDAGGLSAATIARLVVRRHGLAEAVASYEAILQKLVFVQPP